MSVLLSFKDYLRCAGNPFSFFVYLGYLTPKIMDENTRLLQYDMDWETFQRVLYYTKSIMEWMPRISMKPFPFRKKSL